jgi:hypothetical protein
MNILPMRIAAYLKPENGPLGRAFGSWLDHAPAGLASRFLLMWFVILYTGFAIIASGTLGLHPDLLETYVLGLHPAAGYAGMAPLAPWLAGAWFRLFPPTDWAFHLLAMVNAAIGLLFADRIARLYLDGDKQIAVLLFLLLTPFYQFMGQGFGAAQTVLSTWPLATWCFLRAFATRNLAWSAAAGATGALAVLGDYYSLFLIAGFALAVLAHPRGGIFLRSVAPWLALAVGAIVLTPNAAWLVAKLREAQGAGMATLDASAPVDPLWHTALAVAGLAVMLAVYLFAVRPGRATLRDIGWPPDPDGRTLLIVLVAPLVLPALAVPFIGGAVLRWWPVAAPWFLLPVMLLRPEAAVLTRVAAIRITALVAATTIAALAAAPWLAWRQHTEGTAEGREYYRLVATEVTKAWRLATGQPLRVVTGDPQLVRAAVFYSPDHPAPAFGALPASGYAAICRTDDEACISAAKQQVAGNTNVEFITYSTMSPYLGKPGRLGRFFFILVPPPGSKAPPVQIPGTNGR